MVPAAMRLLYAGDSGSTPDFYFRMRSGERDSMSVGTVRTAPVDMRLARVE